MAHVVEDGTGRSDATSLVDVTWVDEYLESTGYASAWASISDIEVRWNHVEAASRKLASDFEYRGKLLSLDQTQPFPRDDLEDREGRTVTGVPDLVKICAAELAFHMSQNNFLQDSELATLDNVRVGPIELKVSSQAKITKHVPDSVIRYMSEYGYYRFGRRRQRSLIGG